jgi:hypothetical protein
MMIAANSTAVGARAIPRGLGWMGTPKAPARTRAAGFDGHLVKPVDLHFLTRMIAESPIGVS